MTGRQAMKKAFIIIAGLAVLAAVGGLAAAWARGGEGDGRANDVAVDAADSGREVELSKGATMTLALDSNVTTGFEWRLAGELDESVLELKGQEYVGPEEIEGEEPLVGAGGQEVWTFKAAGEGKTSLRLEYAQSWEGGMESDELFELTVNVQ